jgi:hypothetical protein
VAAGGDRLLKTFDAKFWGVVVMGGAVIILFFLPWLDRSPVKSIRYRPAGTSGCTASSSCSSSCWATWASSRRRHRHLVSQVGTLFYFGFFLLMPWWSQIGEFKPVPDRVTFTRTEAGENHDTMKNPLALLCLAGAGPGGPGCRRRHRLGQVPQPRSSPTMAALQNGAKLFVNYCLNCHSAAFMRYNRLKDIGLTESRSRTTCCSPPTRSARR